MLKKVASSLYLISLLLFIYAIIKENILLQVIGIVVLFIGVGLRIFLTRKELSNKVASFEVFDPKTGLLRMAQLPNGVSESKVRKIHVQNGEQVGINHLLLEVETDKVILEIVSPCKSKIETINVEQGQGVFPGQVLVKFCVA